MPMAGSPRAVPRLQRCQRTCLLAIRRNRCRAYRMGPMDNDAAVDCRASRGVIGVDISKPVRASPLRLELRCLTNLAGWQLAQWAPQLTLTTGVLLLRFLIFS